MSAGNTQWTFQGTPQSGNQNHPLPSEICRANDDFCHRTNLPQTCHHMSLPGSPDSKSQSMCIQHDWGCGCRWKVPQGHRYIDCPQQQQYQICISKLMQKELHWHECFGSSFSSMTHDHGRTLFAEASGQLISSGDAQHSAHLSLCSPFARAARPREPTSQAVIRNAKMSLPPLESPCNIVKLFVTSVFQQHPLHQAGPEILQDNSHTVVLQDQKLGLLHLAGLYRWTFDGKGEEKGQKG